MNITIKEIASADVDSSQEIFNSLEEDYIEFDKWIAKVKSDPERKVLVASTVEDNYVAVAIIKPEEWENDYFSSFPVTKLSTFKVREDYRNLGIGTALLGLAVGVAKVKGTKAIYLETLAKQENLIGFLEANKFVRFAANYRGEIVMSRLGL